MTAIIVGVSCCGSISHGIESCTLCLSSPGMFTVATQTVERKIFFFNQSKFLFASFACLSVAYSQNREAWDTFVQGREQRKYLFRRIIHYVVKTKMIFFLCLKTVG